MEVQQYPDRVQHFFYGYIVVAASILILLVVWGVYNAFGIFFKPMLAELGWSRGMTSGAFSFSWFVQGLLAIPMGRLNDRFGPRLVLTICGLIMGLGYILTSQVGAIWQLYLFYGVIIGTGMGGSYIPLVSTVARWFVKRRTLMTGIVLSGLGLGGLVAPPLANWLIHAYDWRISYIILGSSVLLVVVLASQLLKRDPHQVGQKPYGHHEVKEDTFSTGDGGLSIREVIRTRQFRVVSATLFSFGFVLHTILVHIVPHATDIGVSAGSAANVLAIIGGFSILGRVVMGSAADKIGNKKAFGIGFVLMSTALFGLVPAIETWVLYPFAIVFGFAFGSCAAQTSPLVAHLFGLRSHGLIMGFVSFSYTCGAAIGPFLAGYVFDIAGSYQLAFSLCAALSVVGAILSIFLTPTKRS